MIDAPARRLLEPILTAAGRRLARLGVSAEQLTAAGFVVGVAAAVAAASAAWWLALGLWLANRALDGLDGAVARVRGVTDRGGLLDLLADFTVYGAFVVGVAVAVPDARLAAAVLLLTYYVNGSAFLALSSLAERRAIALDDSSRSFRFVGGLAEGGETILAHSAFCLVPAHAATVAWAFAAAVAITALQRVMLGLHLFSHHGSAASARQHAEEPERGRGHA